MVELFNKVKLLYRFSNAELRDLAVSIILVSVMFGFDDGRKAFHFGHWLLNFIIVFVNVGLAFWWSVTIQKIVALASGYYAEYRAWSYGLAIGIMMTVASKGHLYLILPGGVLINMMAAHRLGKFRYGLNYSTMGWIAASGPIANIFAGMFVKQLMNMLGFGGLFFEKLIFINFVLAFFLMLPIPPLPGISLFFGTRLGYVFLFGSIMGYVGLFVMGFYSLIYAVMIGVVCYIIYYVVFEKQLWNFL